MINSPSLNIRGQYRLKVNLYSCFLALVNFSEGEMYNEFDKSERCHGNIRATLSRSVVEVFLF